MPHYGLLGDYQFREATDDIRGTSLYGLDDEKLGKIQDVIFDHSNGDVAYLVVDTGGWLSTKKFVVPANEVRSSARHDNDFVCALTKEQIEALPSYEEKDLNSEQDWDGYEDRYRSKWENGPVMHRAETDRNITPTTEQLQGNPNSTRAAGIATEATGQEAGPDYRANSASEEAASVSTARTIPPGTDSVVIDNTAVGIGARWDTFQARLRERRKEAAAGCTTCKAGPGTVSGSERASELKSAI